MTESESWETWREHVLAEIQRSNDNSVILNSSIVHLQIEIAKLQIKSGMWGLFGGLVPIVVLLAVQKIK
jgi:hypothetical protein